MRAARIVFVIFLTVAATAWSASAQSYASHDSANVPRTLLTAHPVSTDITIDGRLDESPWREAAPITGFAQLDPEEGAPASQRTKVRVLYGTDHLYVGAMLYDDDPDGISDRLGPRDELNQADWFILSIDSQYDQRTAFVFGVSAAGVQYDALRTGGDRGPGSGEDESWDAIWDSAVQITDEGWVVEMRIPYSMLRFSAADEQVWGIHFTRRIPRLGERLEWPLVPRSERSNLVAGYGELEGIQNVEPRRTLQVRPYTLSRHQIQEHATDTGTLTSETSVDVGADLKVGISSNITLDVTLNPDFGQVEADPAVLNLTAFETFFDERRPFFLEGTQIYEFQLDRQAEMLYTRRIGAHAPIVGAAKLSGRTGRGLSFGVLGASTGHDFSPNHHYGVARLTQQLNHSSIGGILTGYDGPAGDTQRRSLAGGLDWDLRFADNTYGLEGWATFTHDGLSASDAAGLGWAGSLQGARRRGVWTYNAGLDVYSDRFNPNDVGRLQRNNYVRTRSFVRHDINSGQPFGGFQRADVGLFLAQDLSYARGTNLGLTFFAFTNWTLQNFKRLRLRLNGNYVFGGYNLFETRGLDPWAAPRRLGVNLNMETDSRREWQLEPEIDVTSHEDGGWEYAGELGTNWNIASPLNLKATLGMAWERGVMAWSSNETFLRANGHWLIGTESTAPEHLGPDEFVPFDAGGSLDAALAAVSPVTDDGHYYRPVFGARDTRSVDMTLRGTFTLSPRLSLQLYGQLFLARGRYNDFQLLQDPDTLVPFSAFPKRDEFSFTSFQTNAVFRWEYLPGSNIYVVWSQGRSQNDVLNPLAPWGASPYERPLDTQLGDTFGIIPTNTFMLKVEYTFLR